MDDVERQYSAKHYVLVDDKLHLLTAGKRSWRERVTTIFSRQGHYAHDPQILASYPLDVSLDRVGDLLGYDLSQLCRGTH